MQREPLVHFLIAGALLYVIVSWWNDDLDPTVIKVDRESLVEFYQYRSRSFSSESEQKFAALSEDEQNLLIQQFIEEEALYREALALNLDKADYVIRRRLVQKMEFLSEQPTDEPDLEALEAYFAANQSDFAEPDRITFTHVFVSQDLHKQGTKDEALRLLAELKSKHTPLHKATEFGDHFPYNRNYVERTGREISAHFGALFAEQIFAKKHPLNTWFGPVESAFGYHLVLVQSYLPGRVDSFTSLLPQIVSAFQAEQFSEQRSSAIREIVDRYQAEISPDLGKQTKPLEQ